MIATNISSRAAGAKTPCDVGNMSVILHNVCAALSRALVEVYCNSCFAGSITVMVVT